MRGVKLPSADHRDRHIVSGDELTALADAVGEALASMVYLGAVLGLRWGECAGLRVGHVDFLRSTISVAEQITCGRGGKPVMGPPKSAASRRVLTVPAPLMTVLSEHLARRGLTFHDLRRANATALVLEAVDLKTAQTRLGHSDPV